VYNEVVAEAGSPARLVAENRQAFVNEPLLLGISIDSSTGYETVMLAGLVLGAQLSTGARVSDASWQLLARDLKDVYVHAPKDFVGTMNATIELLSRNKRLMESRAVRLEWIPKPSAPQPNNNPASEALGVRAMAPEAANLIERGRDLLRSGDVASARLLFQRLADVGIADAALALAATYDPRYLAERNLIGVVGDVAKARDWYHRASELGSIEAGRELARTATK
jgi:TPR repeat protein